MGKNWLKFGSVWLVCLFFYFAYRQWMAWFILMSVSFLPLLSLVVSLPAMLLARPVLQMPAAVMAGTVTPLELTMQGPLPAPVWQARVEARHSFSPNLWLLEPGFDCPTEHCGALYIQVSRCRIYDYMGLFWLPKKSPETAMMLVRPRRQRVHTLPDQDRNLAPYWKPKAGGGFSENHELRLYRPGDSLRQIHWKLSGKTRKLIYREPMELVNDRLVLRLTHGGDPDELDRKLGRLLWLGQYLLYKGIAFDIQADSIQGDHLWKIRTGAELDRAVNQLLCIEPLPSGNGPARQIAGWEYEIGGEAYEGKK
jgi:hypothetical protein